MKEVKKTQGLEHDFLITEIISKRLCLIVLSEPEVNPKLVDVQIRK